MSCLTSKEIQIFKNRIKVVIGDENSIEDINNIIKESNLFVAMTP